MVAKVAGGFMWVIQYAGRSTLDVLRDITNNQKLIAVLCGQYGDYGLPPSESSFAMHASVVRHYFNGGAYPIGGSARMFESIQPIIAAAGGLVVTNAEVKQVQTSGGKAVGVEMADGQVFTAPT